MADVKLLGGGKVESNSVVGRGLGRVQVTLDTKRMEQEPNFIGTMQGIGTTGMEYARRIVADTAYDTGELYSSIDGGTRIRNGRREAYVSVSAPHWAFIEYGTGYLGAATNTDIAGIYTPSGWRYDYAGQGWVGVTARPYLRPAMTYIEGVIRAGGYL